MPIPTQALLDKVANLVNHKTGENHRYADSDDGRDCEDGKGAGFGGASQFLVGAQVIVTWGDVGAVNQGARWPASIVNRGLLETCEACSEPEVDLNLPLVAGKHNLIA